MAANLDPIVADCVPPGNADPWRLWGPALMAISLAAWGIVLTAAKLIAALV